VSSPGTQHLQRVPAAPVTDYKTRQGNGRRYWALLLAIVAAALLIRIAFGLADDAMPNDATAYLDAGRNLWEGKGFLRDGAHELHFPPLTSLMVGGLWKLLGDPHTALVVLTVITGTLALLPMAAIARRLEGDTAGLAAAGIGAGAGAFAAVPTNSGGGSEGLYLTLFLTALCAAIAYAGGTAAKRKRTAGLAGVAAGLAYLTRPEAILLAGGLFCLLLIADLRTGGRGRLGLGALAFLIPFCLFALPYLNYLHAQTGNWELTGKARDVSIAAWRALAEGNRQSRDAVLYKLDKTGFRFPTGRTSLARLAARNPEQFAAIVGINASTVTKLFVLPEDYRRSLPVWPLVPVPLVAMAIWAAARNRRNPGLPFLLLGAAVPVFTVLAFIAMPRYLIPTAGVVAVLAGVGVAQISVARRKLALAALAVLLVYPLVAGIGDRGGIFDRREPVEHRIAAQWIRDNSKPSDRIISRSMVVRFYAERPTVPIPFAALPEVVRFARHHGIRYIVADQFTWFPLRPQLAEVFGEGPWEGLKLVHQFSYRGRITRIFELDPPATERSSNPPRLGYVADS
jgi:4-amino-4-deoxy-L-arabinose transferase-like glycosyltransferase